MGYQVYRIKKDDGDYRFGGYGVPTICEHPECKEKINRGVSFACGGEPFSDYSCDRYFCEKHRKTMYWNTDTAERCEHEEDCDCEYVDVCEKCYAGDAPFPYKPEHIDWVIHVLKDSSWKEWREENPEMVKDYKKIIK